MASSVATPLERQFGRIAAVTEMTSSSSLGSTSITLQFDLDRNIDAAARDVQAAINAARGYLPANLPTNPNYRKVNPSDSPILILSLTSSSLSKGEMYDAASTVMAQMLSQVEGVGQVIVGGGALPGGPRGIESVDAEQLRHRARAGENGDRGDQLEHAQRPGVRSEPAVGNRGQRPAVESRRLLPAHHRLSQRRARAHSRRRRCRGFGRGHPQLPATSTANRR